MAEHLPDGFRRLSGAELPGETIAGKPVVAFCGIGNPSSFKETLSFLKADVRRLMAFRDHRVYDRSDLRRILSVARHHNADWIVTTEKDIMKLREFDLPENLISVRIQFTLADRFYERIFMEADHG
jgi:tetraacyldisaccharide 4'-kinase